MKQLRRSECRLFSYIETNSEKTLKKLLHFLGINALSLIILYGCGGFYKIEPTTINDLPHTTTQENTSGPYLTAKTYFYGENILLSKEFRAKRKSNLTYLAISMTFNQPGLANETRIPLYFLNLKEGNSKRNIGGYLISKFPIFPNERATYSFKIETNAIEESKAEYARKIWEKSEPLIGQAVLAEAGPVISIAYKSATDVIKDLTTNRQFNDEVDLSIPRNFSIQSKKRATAYLIIPTDKNGAILEEFHMESGREFNICRTQDENQVPHLCSDGRAYTKLPYIMVEYEADEYVQDNDLLPQEFSPTTCVEVDADRIKHAEQRLLVPRDTPLFSDQQRAEESNLLDLAKSFLKLRDAVENWQTDSTIARKHAAAIDSYFDLRTLRTTRLKSAQTSLYLTHFHNRVEQLNQCAEIRAQSLPTYVAVKEGIDILKTSKMEAFGTRDVAEKSLRALNAIVTLDEELKKLGPSSGDVIRETRLYETAGVNIFTLEKDMYGLFYEPKIIKLQQMEGNRDLYNELLVLLNTACIRCREQTQMALKEYDARTKAVAGEKTKVIEAVATAAGVATELAGREQNRRILGNPTEAESLRQTRENLENKTSITTQSPTQSAQPVKELLQELRKATDTLRQP